MSRTMKDRPYWVRANDPKSPRRASHKHMITCHEKVGEEPVYRNALDKDGWHWKPEVWYTRPLFKRWTERVPCTLNVPEKTPSSWRHRTRRIDESYNDKLRKDKHCNYWLIHDGDYVSGKAYKRLTHSAERGKVRTQLHNALRDFGSYWEEGDWEEVDIHNDSKYASRGWWDW